jgi:hypothetical protein
LSVVRNDDDGRGDVERRMRQKNDIVKTTKMSGEKRR